MRFGLALGLAVALLSCIALTGCSRQRRPGIPPKNVLLITIDDLRPDHLSCYGYMRPTSSRASLNGVENPDPKLSFDALADTGVLFATAYAPSGSTFSSLATLFTGRSPLETGVADDRSVLAPDVPTMAELLGRAGFATAACMTARRGDARVLPRRGFETFETGTDDDETIRRALQWMKRDLGNGRPFFLWLHLSGLVPSWKRPKIDPASGSAALGAFADPAYRGPADGSTAYLERVANGLIDPTDADVAHTIDLYDGEIAHVLGLMSDFLLQCFTYETSEVEATECWARTLLILTSPHGIELHEHGEERPTTSFHEDILHVPLVFRHPDSLTGERVFAGPIELQDVLPTVLEWFDIPRPSGVHARSLLARTDASAKRRFEERPAITSMGDRLYSARSERWRLIWNPSAATRSGVPATAGLDLYDHVSDPWEIHDVAAQNMDVVRELENEIRAWRKSQITPRPASAR